MTMHITHPSLSTTGKKKGKQKFASAEAKRKHEQLNQEWDELKRKHGVQEEDRKRNRAMSAPPLVYDLGAPPGRGSTKHIPSLNTGAGVAPLPPTKVYTGTAMIGIGQLHKSNAVPVFSSDDAADIAKMRR
jgi:hypothetical protein